MTPTPNQRRILKYLNEREASYQYAIERDLEMQPGVVAGSLLRMQVRGWIEKCGSPDPEEQDARGKKYYRLTKVGRRVMEEG